MIEEIVKHLGPLVTLVGTWEGDKGTDIAPSDDRKKTAESKYRELMKFEAMGPINNHEQELYGLKYSTMAWRVGHEAAFHEDTGYWLWDAQARQVMRCFVIPRGIAVLAGGTAATDSTTLELAADVGSPTYGICSNLFLDREFQTVRYELKVTFHGDSSFTYESDTQLKMKGRSELFHHQDKNTFRRIN